jgi:hypothetical protein
LGEGPVPGLLESEGSFQPADMSFRKRFSDADLSRRLSDTRLSDTNSSLDIGELRQTAKQRTMSLTALDSLQPTRKSKKHDQHSSQKKHEQKLDYTESMYLTELCTKAELKWLVLPWGRRRGVWDVLVLTLVLYTALVLPYTLAFMIGDSPAWIRSIDLFSEYRAPSAAPRVPNVAIRMPTMPHSSVRSRAPPQLCVCDRHRSQLQHGRRARPSPRHQQARDRAALPDDLAAD